MPSIKEWGTGRLGNIWGSHPNTDHVNTKGLDNNGIPSVEGYIDEDIVRAFDDNRPLINLLSNDDILNRALDSSGRNLEFNAYIQNDYNDWKLSVGDSGHYTDPENFLSDIVVTPLNVGVGVAYVPSTGFISTGFKKLVGLAKNNGTTLYVDEHAWYYTTVPLLDDPDITYSGFYRPIYTELPASDLPTTFANYILTVRQLHSTGAVYTFPIYSQNDIIIPFSSSIFNVVNEPVNFNTADYPGYNHYPDSFFQLVSAGLGVLEIGQDAKISKNLKKMEHKLSASDFNAEGGAYKAELQEDVFRLDKSGNVNRIENDTNFLRVITGVKYYNQTSRVYFKDHKDATGVLLPVADNRDFLGSQEYSFEVGFYEATEGPNWETVGLALLNAERGNNSQFTSTTQNLGTSFSAQVEAANSLYGDYGYKVEFFADAINCYGTKTIASSGEVYVRAYIYISDNYNLQAAGNSIRVLSLISTTAQELVSINLKANGVTPELSAWETFIYNAGTPLQSFTTNFSKSKFHKIEMHFKAGTGADGGGDFWVDDILIRSDLTINLSTYLANTLLVGPSQAAGNSKQGSYLYFDDIKADTVRVENYRNRYREIYVTSPETRGYQDFGLSIADPSVQLSLSGAFGFNITINGYGPSNVNVYVNLIATDALYDVATKVQAQLDVLGTLAQVRVFNNGGSWELRIYSKSSGSYSTVALTNTAPPDLAAAMGSSGYLTAVPGITDWAIYQTPGSLGDHKAIRSAGVTTQNDFTAGTIGYQIFTSMITAGFDDFTVGLNNVPSFSHTCELYIATNSATQGYQTLNMNVPDSALDSGLLPLSTYYFKLSIDNSPYIEYSFTSTTNTTYQGVINSLNSILAGLATVSINLSNDIVITSDSYGPNSIIRTADGTTGTSLFGFAFPAAGFPPAALHGASVAGTGKVVSVKPRNFKSFTIVSDAIKERAVYSLSDGKIYITPDTETDIRDHVDTYVAFLTNTSANRWSTNNDRVIILDLSTHASWTAGASITKVYTLTLGSDNYLLIGNSKGQIFFHKNGNLYNEDMIITSEFTILTSGVIGVNSEQINNFFLYNDTINNKKFLFVLAQTYIYHTEVTSGLVAGNAFTAINTSSSGSVSNVYDVMFSQIRDAESWNANVSSGVVNYYVIFVGKSEISTWENAPILYALYNTSTFTFIWYAEETYKKWQIDNVYSITKYSGWQDPEQGYQLFITNNANGPELWTGNSQNNVIDIGGGGDDRFNRFSWIEPNHENGANPLTIDADLNYFTFVKVYDDRMFIGGWRNSASTFGGLYSYGFKKVEKYFSRDGDQALVHPSGNSLFITLYNDTTGNAEPAIVKISQEIDEGRAQVISENDLTTVSNWASNSAFRVVLSGFNVGGIDYDGEYNVVFNGAQPDIVSIVAAINGEDLAAQGLRNAFDVAHPPVAIDLTPAIRARVLTSLEYFGGTYVTRYKLAIESKTSAPGEGSGHSTSTEPTQSNCSITIEHPTTGTTVVGSGNNTIEVQPATIAYANLPLVEWSGAELYQLKRVSTSSINFNGNSYINITPQILSGYKILTGSFRVKANSTDETGYSQGNGKVLKTTTPLTLATGTYSFGVEFDATHPTGSVEVSRVVCVADIAGSLSGKYFLINAPINNYYVWYNVTGATPASVDPAILGRVGVQVTIVLGSSATNVGTATAIALTATGDFTAGSVLGTVTATNNSFGNVVDASAGNSGFTVSTTSQGSGGSVTNLVFISGALISTVQDLTTSINSQISGGTASLQSIGGTAEYCDIVITSNTVGDNSSVRIFELKFGLYLFGKLGLSLIPNKSIQGNTALSTSGSQTLGFTWETSDYFLEYNHPDTTQVRIYIPNGTTRLNTGSTIWLDFWQWKVMTKIPAKIGLVNNIPVAGQWTYDIEQKKIVLGAQPSTVPPEDIIFVDIKVNKVLAKMDLGSTIPSNQIELSNEFHAVQPRNLENSEISVARSLARINALHYGIDLWGADVNDQIVVDYSYFLPRLDLLVAKRDPDRNGNKVIELKGMPDSNTPYIEIPQVGYDDMALLYATYVNSQNYNTNNIVELPWYASGNADKNKIYLNGSVNYFRSENEFISDRGLTPLSRNISIDKVVGNNDYRLVYTTDPVGTFNFRNRDPLYNNLDVSQCIFLSLETGSDIDDGTTRDTAVQTLQQAIDISTSARPYILIIRSQNLAESVYTSATINKNFKLYIIAEYIASIPQLSVNSECYIQGLHLTSKLLLLDDSIVTTKYCLLHQITTDGLNAYSGLNLNIYNSIIDQGGLVVVDSGAHTHNITGAINVLFSYVFVKSDAQLLNFNPHSYNTSAINSFIFNNITNGQGHTGTVIICPHQLGINITIDSSILPADTTTKFASDAPVIINRSLTYSITNSGVGSIVSNDSKVVNAGQIDINTETGASNSVARGFNQNSAAINYIDRHLDAGSFLETRIENVIKNDEENSQVKSFLHLELNRVEYRYDLFGDKLSIYIRFRPSDDFQTGGVLFDSRYSGDFDVDSGLFNKNSLDFFQIVYDNKTYEVSYLDSNKYCFKAIFSNGLNTSVAVIGPYFTLDNNSDYNNWHEVSILLAVKNTYNNKYDFANFSEVDKERLQTIIFTMFDAKIDRIYGLKNHLFEDAGGNNIATTKWYPGMAFSRFFNIGGGWTASWITTISGFQWTTWAESTYHMDVDDFAVSHDVIPANILLNIGKKEVVDLKLNDWRIGRWDDKTSGVICHCDNPEPFSENGIRENQDYYSAFRPYEGFDGNALAIESASPNLVIEGRIKKGNWFDRSSAYEYVAGPTTIWAAQNGISGTSVAVLSQRSSNLTLDFVDFTTHAITNTVTVVASQVPAEAVMAEQNNYLVVGYIKSDNQPYFNIVSGVTHVLGTEYSINSAVSDYISVHPAHSSSQAIFTYHSASRGYVVVLDITSGSVIAGPTEFGGGVDISYSAAAATNDKDGNDTYTIFWREASTNYLKYVMYDSTLVTQVFATSTLIQTDHPIDLRAETFGGLGNIFIKWKDYVAASDSAVKGALINREGLVTTPSLVIYAAGDPSSLTGDFIIRADATLLFAVKDRTTQHIVFKLYGENVLEVTNSPYLRPYDEATVGNVLLSFVSNSENYAVITDISTNGDLIVLDTNIPTRWFRDFRGVFDLFDASVQRTETLFGYAMAIDFNHASSAGETGVFVAAAEIGNITEWPLNTQTGGTITATTDSAIHGTYGYKFTYDGTGNIVNVRKTNVSSGTDLYARFYIELDKFFTLTGSLPRSLEVASFGPNASPVVISIVYNDPGSGGDGKFKLKAAAGIYGTFTSANSLLNYGNAHWVDIHWVNDLINGGWELWFDSVSQTSQLSQNTSAAGNPDTIRLGNATVASTPPALNAKIYFDDARVDTAFIGEYTAGLGDGQLWQPTTIALLAQHYISGYYSIESGNFVLELEGTSTGAGGALVNPIIFNFLQSETGEYIHTSKGLDNVNYVEVKPLNFNKLFRFVIGFVPDSTGYLNIRFKSAYTAIENEIDSFEIDNVKLEQDEHPTSIIVTSNGYAEYNFNLKSRGSAYFRIVPEFFITSADHNHTIFSGYTTNEAQAEYITHELYYDNSTNTFKFYITDFGGTTALLESDDYGDAQLVSQLTDLNEKHVIVCNWDVIEGFMELYIDTRRYYRTITLGIFKNSDATVIGNRHNKSTPADCLFDLIRVGEDPLTEEEVSIVTFKRDPFVHPDNIDVGVANVKSLSFFGMSSGDLYDANIYTEQSGNNWNLVIDKGPNFQDNVIIRHEGKDVVIFGSQGVVIDGSLQVTNLIAETTTSVVSVGDHITLRYGFSGYPLPTNDAYLEVERGNLNNSEVRWDESQKAWTFNNGTDNRISIDGSSIGTWKNNDGFDIDVNGSGILTFKTNTAPSDGSSLRAGGFERLRIAPSEVVFNNPRLTTANMRMASGAKDYMFYLNTSIDRINIGRAAGAIPTLTGYTTTLGIDTTLSIVHSTSNNFGSLVLASNDGTVASHIGFGDNTTTPKYWEIATKNGELRMWGSDLVMGSSGHLGIGLNFFEDKVNARLAYTADASAQTVGTSLAGVYCYGSMTAYKIFHNVWNDYAEAFEFDKEKELNPQPGFVYKMTNNGLVKTQHRADLATVGVCSDTYGQLMGSAGLYDEQHPDGHKLPIALMGQVRVWVKEKLIIGDKLVSDKDGFATKASEIEIMMNDVIGMVLEISDDDTEKRIWILKK